MLQNAIGFDTLNCLKNSVEREFLIIHKLILKGNEMFDQQWIQIHSIREKNESVECDPLINGFFSIKPCRRMVAAESKAETADGYCSLEPINNISACMNKKQNQNFSFHFYSNTTEFTQKKSSLSGWCNLQQIW